MGGGIWGEAHLSWCFGGLASGIALGELWEGSGVALGGLCAVTFPFSLFVPPPFPFAIFTNIVLHIVV